MHCLYIPKKLQKDVFKLVYDDIGHPGGQRIYKYLLTNFFLLNTKTDLMKYMHACPACVKSKPS